MKAFFFALLLPTTLYASDFKPYETSLTKTLGAVRIVWGTVSLQETAEVELTESKKLQVVVLDKVKTFDQADAVCKGFSKGWRLPSADDLYTILFFDLFPR